MDTQRKPRLPSNSIIGPVLTTVPTMIPALRALSSCSLYIAPLQLRGRSPRPRCASDAGLRLGEMANATVATEAHRWLITLRGYSAETDSRRYEAG